MVIWVTEIDGKQGENLASYVIYIINAYGINGLRTSCSA
jgi:hypothetical protein